MKEDDRFCDQCGAAVADSSPAVASTGSSDQPASPVAERKLVTILFADLVGFTALSESRDVEEVRELLTRYFDSCKRLISLYGGTVEKFIGDAVMAVWGAPTALEDDAERAVRTALDLTAAVAALGQEVGAPDLKARAGVLTGEAAVTLGAEGQGMVAGDLVNTTSRIQAAAPPGAVFVGGATKRSTDDAVAYEEAGEHELKGKAEPVRLWRALRILSGRRGALKSSGLEPPFVGRDRELRMVKDLFHGAMDDRKASLVSVIGIAGIGKSRLSWEFFKYIDGLVEGIDWHRGRCLPYGEGVTYWALAEMVRMRAGITEGEEASDALLKLQATVRERVPDTEEQRWVEPRLAHLLGLEDGRGHVREDLFAAWRLFFERMAEDAPTIMVFEDTQWADQSMLDFIDYMMDWSKNHPIFVLALTRPDLLDNHPTWGAGKRNFTPIYLEALPPEAMETLLAGLVPGLPSELREQIRDRAEGVPLYAVETVRMLLDRGVLVRDGDGFRTTETVTTLEVPESLHALIAARLDGLAPDERTVIQNAAVLGKTFTRKALSAVTAMEEERLEPVLTSLSRKEILTLQVDPRSPERGQYGFLQDLMKRVAYETLSKHERKVRHLASARYLRQAWGAEEDEIVEVVASHYLEAYRSTPDAPDAAEIKNEAGVMLRRAGERAASLAASEEARRYFEKAAEMTDDTLTQASLHERAGQMAWYGGRLDLSKAHYEKAIELFESEGDISSAAGVSARFGEVIWAEGHIDEATKKIEHSIEVLQATPTKDLAWSAAQLGRFLYFMGEVDRAAERIEQALDMAESMGLPDVLSQALNTKCLILAIGKGRPEEGMALLRHALVVALDNDVPSAAQRAYYNLSNLNYYQDLHDEAMRYATEGLALARRVGDRDSEWSFMSNTVSVLYWTGQWDEALATAALIPRLDEIPAARFASVELLVSLPPLLVARGRVAEAEEVVASFSLFAESADLQERSSYRAVQAVVLRAQGRPAEALAAAEEALQVEISMGATFVPIKFAMVEAFEAALALGDGDRAAQLAKHVLGLSVGTSSPYLRAQGARFQALLEAVSGDPERAEAFFKESLGHLREIEVPFWMGVTALEYAEWLSTQARNDEAAPLLKEAVEIFTKLEATPWLERASTVRPEVKETEPAASV